MGCKMCHLVIGCDAGKDGSIALGVWLPFCIINRIESEKLVTPCSLRLGFDLLREKNCIELRPILSDCRVRDRENLAGSKLKIPTVQRILERSDKSPFDKGGFRGNVDALITRKGELFDSPFLQVLIMKI